MLLATGAREQRAEQVRGAARGVANDRERIRPSMMCVLKMDGGEITNWLIGSDTYDLRRQAEVIMRDMDTEHLVEELARLDLLPVGKHQLNSGHTLLVS